MDLETAKQVAKLNDKRLNLINKIEALKSEPHNIQRYKGLEICYCSQSGQSRGRYEPIYISCHENIGEKLKDWILSECKKMAAEKELELLQVEKQIEKL